MIGTALRHNVDDGIRLQCCDYPQQDKSRMNVAKHWPDEPGDAFKYARAIEISGLQNLLWDCLQPRHIQYHRVPGPLPNIDYNYRENCDLRVREKWDH